MMIWHKNDLLDQRFDRNLYHNREGILVGFKSFGN